MAPNMENGQQEHSSEDSLPSRLAAVPLVLDEDTMEVDEDQELEDLEDGYVRDRINAARTLFHQPRGDNDTMNSTRSIYDSDIVYKEIHGRRYCGDYYMPNDEEEQDRLQILHGLYLHLFDNKLTTVPLNNPEKILDIGTGTGEWAMAMADEYPEAEVIATDIAKIQPGASPLNVFFEIDDAEEEGGWTWPEDEFDFVHFRSMAGAFEDWKHIYQESLKHLKPGGWIEVLDFDNVAGFLSYFPKDSVITTWSKALQEATEISGRPRGSAHMSRQMVEDIGFVDVKVTERFIPMGVWPKDREELKIGKHFLVSQLCGVEAVCLRPLVEQKGWDIDKIRQLCDAVTDLVKSVALDPEKSQGLGFQVKCLIGRKPPAFEDAESAMGDSIRTMRNGNGGPVGAN